ncbi:skin secretory protein xP2-like [Prinia subflava]|uniref:skin secretory protein xP2-like n=1 Tax=Prinia subflava TaxID=208062 RepID=UPI002FE28A74
MEAIAKVVSVIHRQWEIECKPRDLQLALARLLELGVIERPVEILHSEVWGRCTLALAEDTESTGSGKHLKAWGKVKQSLRKALEEQETWSAARVCLLATPKLGVGATTQTASENDLSECEKPREPSTLPPSRSPSPKPPVPSGNPPTPTPSPSASPPPAEPCRASEGPSSVPLPSIGGSVPEAQQRVRFFWQGLAEEARDAEHVAQESTRPAPPPYGFENGAGGSGEGRGLNVCSGESPEPWVCASAHAQGKAGEEGEKCVLGQEPRASAGACAQQEGRGCMFGAAPRVPAGACTRESGGKSAPGPAPRASAGACAPGSGGESAPGPVPRASAGARARREAAGKARPARRRGLPRARARREAVGKARSGRRRRSPRTCTRGKAAESARVVRSRSFPQTRMHGTAARSACAPRGRGFPQARTCGRGAKSTCPVGSCVQHCQHLGERPRPAGGRASPGGGSGATPERGGGSGATPERGGGSGAALNDTQTQK